MINIRKFSIKKFFHNFYRLFIYDERETFVCQENHTMMLSEQNKQIAELKRILKGHKVAFQYLLNVLGEEKVEHLEELVYIIENGYDNFPYPQILNYENNQADYDLQKQLPFVVHKGKRLYFPKSFSVDQALSIYNNFIKRECILGGEFTPKMPHQYQTKNFKIERGDVLIDIGCAEALLALDSIDIVSRAYLIEGDPIWIPALNATFEPYADKVSILNRYIGNGENDVTLQSLLQKNEGGVFVKMDIEGAEVAVLEASCQYLSFRNDVKVACCTYHKNEDYSRITKIMDTMDYQYMCSDGFMLFDKFDNPKYPFFRNGIIRATKAIHDK